MNYNFNEMYILRYEFFGGLLHSIVNATEFELDFENTTYLTCIKKGYSYKDSIKFVSTYFNTNFIPSNEEFLQENILVSTNNNKKSINYDKFKKEIDFSIKQVINKNYLSFPLQASLYLTSLCQLNCKFCFFKDKKSQYVDNVDYKNWIELIRKLKEYGIIYISLLGGEPTLYNNIDEILKYLNESKIKSTITTNGFKIKDSTIDIICKNKYITPTISLQSLNNNTNKYLMGANTENAINTINKFLSKGKTPRINTVYTNQTIIEIFDLVDFCVKTHISEFYLDMYVDTYESNLKTHSIFEMRKVREEILNYINKKGYNEKINFQVQGCLLYSAYEDDESVFVESDFEKIKYGCEAGNTKLEIMPDGSVLPCVLFKSDSFKFRNAFEEDIKNIWDSADYLINLRKYKCKDSSCCNCKFYDFCNGGCPALKMRKGLLISEVGDDRCQIIKGEK